MADSTLKATIEAREAKYSELFDAGDIQGVSELYTEDCKFLVPGMPTKAGRAGVVEVLTGMKSSGLATVTLGTDEVGGIAGGDTAFERGHYEFWKKDGSSGGAGKYLIIWKKAGDGHQIYLKCFNGDHS